MENKFLYITKKELFYTAAMLKLTQLVNIVYDIPADEAKLNRELDEAVSTLRKKKLLTQSARSGITLSFPLCMCAAFCAIPDNCELIDSENYNACIYIAKDLFMLMEKHSEEEFAATWFIDRASLDEYLKLKLAKGAEE